MSSRSSWWLRADDGSRVPIGSGGVLLGRAADSDIVLTDERASRRHALVHVSGDAARLVALSSGPTELDGTPISGQRTLDAGQHISVPGLTLTVERGPERASERTEEWVLQRPSGGASTAYRRRRSAWAEAPTISPSKAGRRAR
jgi:hypothetical protein